jgi:serine/threonine-protein kinase
VATVYLAEDLKHHRPVAIKVLLPTLAAAIGPERFLREIEVTARLNHPHILPLLDSGEADGLLFYVMPFVEGESLRERLDKDKQLSVEDAVQIAAEVADALGFAHEHNVLHRDIKPENVLFEAGHAVVADFGLALAISAAGGTRLTETGMAVGTPEYMSPEQASGERELSERSDLYSLGCVLYEMLAGEPPFTGPTIESVARQHLTAEPRSVTTLRATVPQEISQSLVKALAKAPADRFGSAAEFRNVIAPRGTISPAGIVAVDRRAKSRWRTVGGVVAAAAVLIVLGFLGTQLFKGGPITVTVSNIRYVTNELGMEWQPALSPDGSQVAFIAQRDGRQAVVIRSTRAAVGGGEARPTQGVHDSHERFPAWSPDGESVGFAACAEALSLWPDCTWMEIGRLGGSIRAADLQANAAWPSWSPDGSRAAFIAAQDSIFTYSVADSTTTLLAASDPMVWSHSPVWSPDGLRIAYVDEGSLWLERFQLGGGSSIWIVEAGGGEPVRVTGDEFMDISPAWLDDDHLLFVSDRDGPREAYVVEVGPTGPRGEARKVAGATDAHTISYSIAGRKLAFSKATVRQNIWSYPIDSGTVSIADGHRVTNENAIIQAHDVSPDGRWIAYSSDARGNQDIYKRSVEGGNPTPIADSPLDEIDPRWSPDGTEIAFHKYVGDRMPVMVVPADGGTPVQVASAPWTWLPSWSPSGLELVFNSNQTGELETWVVSREAVGGPWSEATQITDFGCEPSDWAPDGSGVLCTVGAGGTGGLRAEADISFVLVSREGEVLWRYDPSTAGLVLQNLYQRFSRDGSTIYAAARQEDGTEGVWAIPVEGGEPSLVVAYDDAEIVAERWLSIGPDRLYLTVQQTEIDIWVADVEVER